MNSVRIASAVAAVALALAPAEAQTRRHNLNVNSSGQATSCAELHATSDGALAQAVDRFTIGGSSVEIDGGSRGAIQVIAADRGDYGIEACRFAVADDMVAAQQLLAGATVTQNGVRVETHGPATSDDHEQWQVYLIVQAPRYGNVDVNTVNGPISVRGVSGTVKVKAVNGPLTIADCGGVVDAQTTNGPVTFSGQGGDVKLTAVNGPMTLKLLGDAWNGRRLEASTTNGPVKLTAPDTFRSGVKLETNGGSPFSCNADMCRYAITDAASDHRTLQMNGGGDTVHVITGNGPVSVSAASR